MKTIEEAGTQTLRWVRDEGHPEGFDLLAGDEPVVHLRWKHRGGSLALAETGRGVWSLKRLGLLQPHVTVRGSEKEVDLARLSVHFRQSLLEIGGKPAL
ncbi:MAG: hypothetical protein L3K09_08755, partial [Thermoplasmata archaeon]|nr:hypothetical protein [Thermoplasmata archaeon]